MHVLLRLLTGDILTAKGPWTKKLHIIKMLVESRFVWTAGALHWSAEDLRGANLLQLHTLSLRLWVETQEGRDLG